VTEPKFTRFSAWEYVGNEALKVLQREGGNPGDHVSGSQMVAVMVAAINPAALSESVRNDNTRELADVFTECYSIKPDLTLRLLLAIRKKWNDQSATAKVQRHILTKPYHQRPIVKDGKWIQQGVFHHEATDTDVQAVVVGSKQKLAKAAEASIAKKARQRIKLPSIRPYLSQGLNAALQELRTRGFDVGLG
jgi:hypothetical protein